MYKTWSISVFEVWADGGGRYFIRSNGWSTGNLISSFSFLLTIAPPASRFSGSIPTNAERPITELTSRPIPQTGYESRKTVLIRHNIPDEARIFLFFGPQSYQPNLEAVRIIARDIVPKLKLTARFPFRVLICGGGLPESEQDELAQSEYIQYLGFVDQIEEYIMAADVVLNPILTGGGVKTKIIEAIAFGTTVLSFRTGGLGMNREVCGEKLRITEDNDVAGFVQEMLQEAAKGVSKTPDTFYREYYWGAVADQVHSFLDSA